MDEEEKIYFRKCARKLEIIFEKNVDIEYLKSADTVDEYNTLIEVSDIFSISLTPDEFELLKEYSKTIGTRKEGV